MIATQFEEGIFKYPIKYEYEAFNLMTYERIPEFQMIKELEDEIKRKEEFSFLTWLTNIASIIWQILKHSPPTHLFL